MCPRAMAGRGPRCLPVLWAELRVHLTDGRPRAKQGRASVGHGRTAWRGPCSCQATAWALHPTSPDLVVDKQSPPLSLLRRARQKLPASLQAAARAAWRLLPLLGLPLTSPPSAQARPTGTAGVPWCPHLLGLQVASRHAPCSGKHEGPVVPTSC